MIVDIRHLDFSYRESEILEGINFEVQPGELLAILAPNGVGKTPLLKCLNGMHRASAGAVMIEGG